MESVVSLFFSPLPMASPTLPGCTTNSEQILDYAGRRASDSFLMLNVMRQAPWPSVQKRNVLYIWINLFLS